MKYSYLSDTVNIKKIEEKGNKSIFHIEGLYTGYGITLGNSLRRVLLSSLPGAAVSQVRIKGVKHEFSTIPGMIEDVLEFVLNLKKVRFHFFAEEPQVLKLKVKDSKDIKAGDIESTTLVKVINKDLPLATLTNKKAGIEMEVIVEKGLGYIPTESRRTERLPVGTIMLDCVFSPVVNIRFSVEDMRVGERTDYNRLKIEIETDGSITPSRALHQASNILKDHFARVAMVAPAGGDEEKESRPKTKKRAKIKTRKKSTKTKK